MADVPMQEAPAAAVAPNNGAHPKRPEKERPKGHSSSSKVKDKAAKRKREDAPANGEKSDKADKAEPEFACRVKYRNTLPELPFDPKLRTLALDPMRHVRYRITSLENLYRFPVLTEPDLGIPIDLLDPDTYRLPPNKPSLATEDAAILVKPSTDKVETPRQSVQWLRKHQYITHDYSLEKLYTRGRQDAGRGIQRRTRDENLSVEAQMEAIERGFEAAKRKPVHSTNPKLTPVEVLDIMPELDLWGTQLTHVIYDTSPIPNPPHPSDAEYQQKVQHGEYLILRSVLKGYVWTDGTNTEKFSVLYVPKRSEDDVKAASLFGDENEAVPADSEEVEWVRKYNYKIDNAVKDCFIFTPHPEKGTVTYVPIETKVTLTKSSIPPKEKPQSVTLVREPLNAQAKEARRDRIAALTT